jgi:hypothetical protein
MDGWNKDAELARWIVGASTRIHLVGGFVYKKRQMRVNYQIAFRDYSFKTTKLGRMNADVEVDYFCNRTSCATEKVVTDDIACPWLGEYRLRHSAIIERWKLCGFFEDDDLLDINCHWLQFEPVPLVYHLLLVCIFIFILLTGCLSNIIVIYILGR